MSESEIEIPMQDGESPIKVYIDDEGYICLVDECNDYELAFSPFNWHAINAYVNKQRKETYQ